MRRALCPLSMALGGEVRWHHRSDLRAFLSLNILLAVRDGERDFSRLKTLALDKIGDLY